MLKDLDFQVFIPEIKHVPEIFETIKALKPGEDSSIANELLAKGKITSNQLIAQLPHKRQARSLHCRLPKEEAPRNHG
jgi:hypothetical protein